eukprot:2531550-Lingulodinium_polyedra.AAC.1
MPGRPRNEGTPMQGQQAGRSSCDPGAPHGGLHASKACAACTRPSLAHGGLGSSRQLADKMRCIPGNGEGASCPV